MKSSKIENVKICKNGDIINMISGDKLKPFNDHKGYPKVHLIIDGVRKSVFVHRLVAMEFVPNPKNLPEVNHIDENKSNASYENLEWCDRQYNAEYSLAKHFEFLSPSGERVLVFNLNKFCRENGLNKSNMHKVSTGDRISHFGWKKFNQKVDEGDLSQL